MNISFWISVLFWAFLLGFWLGISFPTPKNKRKRSAAEGRNDNLDFYISENEYANFLSYDGTTQNKE